VYRFALRPRWVLSHLLVLLLIVAMASAGFWQLSRLHQRREQNAEVVARSYEPVASLRTVVKPSAALAVGAELQFRRLVAVGHYRVDEQVLVRTRSNTAGDPGFWVLTPLDLGDGTGIVVNRGWVPFGREVDGSDIRFDTPKGQVTVVGLAQENTGKSKPARDKQVTIDRVDLRWYDRQSSLRIYPIWLQMTAQAPKQTGDLPQILDPPDLSEGPHFSYAVQWFVFTAIAVLGYPVILFEVARDKAKEARWAALDTEATEESESQADTNEEDDSERVPTS